jgi:hypothetical protein
VSRARVAVEPRWIRHDPDRREQRAALAAALGAGLIVGGVVFYLARLLLAREPIQPAPVRGEREAT